MFNIGQNLRIGKEQEFLDAARSGNQHVIEKLLSVKLF